MATKSFSHKSNARRAARTLGLDLDTLRFFALADGTWTWAKLRPLRYRLHYRKPAKIAAVCKGADFGAHVHAMHVANHQTKRKPAVPANVTRAKNKLVTPVPQTTAKYKEFQVYGPSRVLGPVATVHAYLAQHGKTMARKDALKALADIGVNQHTARTQYQVWHGRNK